MRLLLDMHGDHIGLDASGALGAARQWAGYVGAEACSSAAWQAADLRIDVELVPGWLNPQRDNALRVDADGVMPIERPLVSGTLARCGDGLTGRFTANGDGTGPLDGLVSLGLAALCEERGALLLHASAVAVDGHAYLFLGAGGAGKTTIAVELSHGAAIMSVDRTLVHLNSDHRLIACSTPFGDTARAITATGCLPVAGLFFITQATRHQLTALSPWAATQGLLASAVGAERDTAAAQRLMELVGTIADQRRCYRLEFARDAGFWPPLARALSQGEGR